MQPTGKQITMARILLDMSQQDLADSLQITRKTVMRIENGHSPGSAATAQKIQLYFENQGIEFSGTTGIRKRENELKILKGREGMSCFMDELYTDLSEKGGEFCVFNANPLNLINYMGPHFWQKHKTRMTDIREKTQGKLLIQNGEKNLVASNYAEYRWFSEDEYDDSKTLYSYGSKLAFMAFEESELIITVIDRMEFAKGFRVLFNQAWKQAIPIPDHIRKAGKS